MRTSDRSEPACGSVRFMVPVHSPRTIRGRYWSFCACDPQCAIASVAPWVSMGQMRKARLAEANNSSTADTSTMGMPCPP